MHVGIFAVSSYPIVDDVYKVLHVLDKRSKVLTGYGQGIEYRVRAWCYKYGIEYKRINPVFKRLHRDEERKVVGFDFVYNLDKYKLSAMIIFWSKRYGSENIRDIFFLSREVKKRGIPLKVIRPSGFWTENY